MLLAAVLAMLSAQGAQLPVAAPVLPSCKDYVRTEGNEKPRGRGVEPPEQRSSGEALAAIRRGRAKEIENEIRRAKKTVAKFLKSRRLEEARNALPVISECNAGFDTERLKIDIAWAEYNKLVEEADALASGGDKQAAYRKYLAAQRLNSTSPLLAEKLKQLQLERH